jgi:hypothetical protein
MKLAHTYEVNKNAFWLQKLRFLIKITRSSAIAGGVNM